MGMFCEAIVDRVRRLSRLDIQRMVIALLTLIEEGSLDQSGEVVVEELQDFDFPCRQLVIHSGEAGIGLLVAFTTALPGPDPMVVLFVKEGRNLGVSDRNRIRDNYRSEVANRAPRGP